MRDPGPGHRVAEHEPGEQEADQRRRDRRQVEDVEAGEQLHLARRRDQGRRPVVEQALDRALRLGVGEAALAQELLDLVGGGRAAGRAARDLGRERRRPAAAEEEAQPASPRTAAAARPAASSSSPARSGAAARRSALSCIALRAQSRLSDAGADQQHGAQPEQPVLQLVGVGQLEPLRFGAVLVGHGKPRGARSGSV